MAVKCFPRRGSANTNFLMGKNVTSRVAHRKSATMENRHCNSSTEHLPVAGTVCCCPFRGLATIAVSELRPNGTHSGNGARSRSFSGEPITSGRRQSAPSISARVGRFAAARNEERSMAGYGGVDFIDFDSQLNDEEKLVRQTARQFVENEIIPIIEKHSREATFPKHLVPQLGELGFFGANLHGYGCAGMSNVAYGLMTQELERGDSGLRSFVSVQSALVMYPIYSYGSDAQKNKWLPLLQQGKAIGCFGLTEPQFGSNPGGMLTRAV